MSDESGPSADARRDAWGEAMRVTHGEGRRRTTRVRRAAAAVGVLVALTGGLVGCRSTPPMLQPVAPVPTVTQDGAGG